MQRQPETVIAIAAQIAQIANQLREVDRAPQTARGPRLWLRFDAGGATAEIVAAERERPLTRHVIRGTL